NPALSPLAPTISSAISAKVGNSGRMPGRVLPRRDSQTIAAVMSPPTTPFQTMSIGWLGLFGGQRFLAQRQAETLPDLQQGFGEMIDQSVVMIGRRRDPQPLAALGNGRIVDRLDVDVVLFEKDVAGPLAALGIADEQRHDMGLARHHRQARGGQDRLDPGGALLMALALPARCL